VAAWQTSKLLSAVAASLFQLVQLVSTTLVTMSVPTVPPTALLARHTLVLALSAKRHSSMELLLTPAFVQTHNSKTLLVCANHAPPTARHARV